jgi:hypothetical protein
VLISGENGFFSRIAVVRFPFQLAEKLLRVDNLYAFKTREDQCPNTSSSAKFPALET